MLQTILLAETETYIISFAELPAQLIFHALMVLVLFLVLGKLVFQPVLKMMKKRSDTISGNISEAEKSRDEAAALKSEYQEKLDGAMKEREEILADSYKAAQKREEDILNEARNEAASIRAAAEADIAQERKKAVNDLKNEIGGMAVEIAGKVVEREINEADHQALIDEFIRNVGDAS